MLEIAGKRALVTGGAVRIGAQICRQLAEAGVSLAIHYGRSGEAAESLATELEERHGVSAVAVAGALDDPAAVAGLVAEASDALGGVDILVNNAAVFHKESLDEMSYGSLSSELAINALAPIMLTQAFARMYAGVPGEGCVVNILDRRVATAASGELPYQLSKRMLASFTELAALELAPALRVNGVAPGPVLAPPGLGEAYLHDHAGAFVTPARCSASDVADAVLYLARARATTGQIVFVDSGQRFLGREVV